jgi:hypothetical protein
MKLATDKEENKKISITDEPQLTMFCLVTSNNQEPVL